MSFSYIKNVFPDFRLPESKPVEPTKKYNIQENFTPPSSDYAIIPKTGGVPEIYSFGGNDLSTAGQNIQIKTKPQPQPSQLFEQYTAVNQQFPFGNNSTSTVQQKNSSHEDVISHLANCVDCREMFIKQYNLEQSKIFREEIMEFVSYISFSILIIIIIDSFSRK